MSQIQDHQNPASNPPPFPEVGNSQSNENEGSYIPKWLQVVVVVELALIIIVGCIIAALVFIPSAPLNHLIASQSKTVSAEGGISTDEGKTSKQTNKTKVSRLQRREDCGINNSHPVVKRIMAELPKYSSWGRTMEYRPWEMLEASSFDPCAELSAVTFTTLLKGYDGGGNVTGARYNIVYLFHKTQVVKTIEGNGFTTSWGVSSNLVRVASAANCSNNEGHLGPRVFYSWENGSLRKQGSDERSKVCGVTSIDSSLLQSGELDTNSYEEYLAAIESARR